MAVRKFLQWAPTASPAELAEGAGALARAFLYCDLPESEREEARLTLTGLLDDSARSPRPCRELRERRQCAALYGAHSCQSAERPQMPRAS